MLLDPSHLPSAQGDHDLPNLDLLEHPNSLGMGQTSNRASIHREYFITFFQKPQSLTIWKNAFHIDPNGALWRVFPPNNSESQALFARSLFKHHILDAVSLAFSLAWQGAKF